MAQALLRSKSMLKDAERQSNPWVEQLRSPSPEPGRAFGPISQQRAPLEKYTSNHGRHLVEDSSLLDAVWRGNVGAVRRLLKGGADPNAEDILAGRVTTPLCEAVRHAHTNVVRVLLDAGAQPDLVTSTGVSPVSCAESDACFDAVTMVCAASRDARLRRIAEESRCSPTRRVPKHKHLLIVRPSEIH
mmetsp:Transcript_45204/g.98317  ORF Transcript_45204/g.98317 Transcript_45204/m.98317 type:complete len:188 (+) Transcript_45204:199-762(+)